MSLRGREKGREREREREREGNEMNGKERKGKETRVKSHLMVFLVRKPFFRNLIEGLGPTLKLCEFFKKNILHNQVLVLEA